MVGLPTAVCCCIPQQANISTADIWICHMTKSTGVTINVIVALLRWESQWIMHMLEELARPNVMEALLQWVIAPVCSPYFDVSHICCTKHFIFGLTAVHTNNYYYLFFLDCHEIKPVRVTNTSQFNI